MDKVKIQLITPEKIAYEGEVDQVVIPTREGYIGVLPNHVPLISILQPGEITIKTGGVEEFLATGGGCVEVHKEGVRILANSAERAEDIDEMRAIKAKEEAEQLMKQAKDEVAFADAAAYLERNIARLQVVKRKKRH